jgi:hypothetical protein
MSAENALSILNLKRHLEENADILNAKEVMKLIRE